MARAVLDSFGFPTDGLRSKSWNEFAAADAPKMDFIFTVCDNAAGETCPIWPGNPVTANWGIDDPAAVEGEEAQRAAFIKALVYLKNRFSLFSSLPLESIDKMSLQSRLRQIGASEGATPASAGAPQ
jgi:arsenate reductase